jgi:hypothetical protein
MVSLSAPATTALSTSFSSSGAPADSVERPAPGLASGRWEAPGWAFVVIAALTLLGSLAWLALFLRSRRGGR